VVTGACSFFGFVVLLEPFRLRILINANTTNNTSRTSVHPKLNPPTSITVTTDDQRHHSNSCTCLNITQQNLQEISWDLFRMKLQSKDVVTHTDTQPL
jgi:hypothetical protein